MKFKQSSFIKTVFTVSTMFLTAACGVQPHQDAIGPGSDGGVIVFKVPERARVSFGYDPPRYVIDLEATVQGGKRQCVDWTQDHIEIHVGDADFPRVPNADNQGIFECAPAPARFTFEMPPKTPPGQQETRPVVFWYPHNGPVQQIQMPMTW